MPLLYQPGTQWNYSYATDVCARLIEVLSGVSVDEFLRSRLFEPLGMTDTAFDINPADAQHGEWEKVPEKVLVDWDIDMSGGIFIAASKGRKKYKELCQKVDTLGWWNSEDAKYKQDVGRENPEYKLKKNLTNEIFGYCEMRFFRANLVFN